MKRFSAAALDLLYKVDQVITPHEPIFVVGGILRDLYYNISSNDFDFVVEGDAIAAARRFVAQYKGAAKEFPQFLTAKIEQFSEDSEIQEIDFASTREERYSAPGALPLVKAASIEADLWRRDFSINAIAVPVRVFLDAARNSADLVSTLQRQSLDPCGGWADLSQKKLRTLHAASFRDDPTRIFRAARYSARIAGEIESATRTWLESAVSSGALSTISETRKCNELRHIAAEEKSAKALELLNTWKVFQSWPFISPHHSEKFFLTFLRLTDMPSFRGLSAQERFETLLLCATYFGERTERETQLGRYGLSKKFKQGVLSDIDEIRASRTERLSLLGKQLLAAL